jgi:hypothetical protein
MEVVIHQAIGMQEQMKLGDDALQDCEKLLPVLVSQEDVLPGVARAVTW